MVLAAKRLIFRGHVQGVWFRAWTVETAKRIGLVGWVRNRTDGTVEAVVQGTEPAIAEFLVLAHDGPPAARVEAIDTQDELVSDMRDFEKRPTA